MASTCRDSSSDGTLQVLLLETFVVFLAVICCWKSFVFKLWFVAQLSGTFHIWLYNAGKEGLFLPFSLLVSSLLVIILWWSNIFYIEKYEFRDGGEGKLMDRRFVGYLQKKYLEDFKHHINDWQQYLWKNCAFSVFKYKTFLFKIIARKRFPGLLLFFSQATTLKMPLCSMLPHGCKFLYYLLTCEALLIPS